MEGKVFTRVGGDSYTVNHDCLDLIFAEADGGAHVVVGGILVP